MDAIFLLGGFFVFCVIAYLVVFELGFILQGVGPIVRQARKHPQFRLRTLLAGTAVFAIAFALIRETGVIATWRNSWVDYVLLFFFGGISLTFAIGVASMVGLMLSEAKVLATQSEPEVEPAPDFHFLEQQASANGALNGMVQDPIAPSESSSPVFNPVEQLRGDFPMELPRFDTFEVAAAAMNEIPEGLGPLAVDLAIRQALVTCWKALPSENRNFETIAVQFRRLVERALANYEEDCKEFVPTKVAEETSDQDPSTLLDNPRPPTLP